MATDFILNGVRARMHEASKTKITEDGKHVEKEYMENGVLKKFNPKIEIGKNVDIGPLVYLGTGTHVPQFDKERCAGDGLNKDIKIGDGCWLCARTTILPGVTVGNMTIVGAGAVVNKDLPGGITAVGIPAKVLNK